MKLCFTRTYSIEFANVFVLIGLWLALASCLPTATTAETTENEPFKDTFHFLKDTTSICPECRKVLPATLTERDGRVMMVKSCTEHGSYEDVYWSDVEQWKRARG